MAIGTITLASIALAGGGISALGQFQEGQAQARGEEFNASVARQEQAIIDAKRKVERKTERRSKERFISAQAANFAKAGVALTGSPLDVIEDSTANLELDIILNDISASIQRSRLESEVEQSKIQAARARAAGTTRAGLTLLEAGVEFASDTNLFKKKEGN